MDVTDGELQSSPHWLRLKRFFEEHNAEKATDANLSRILRKYWGREDELFRDLNARYQTAAAAAEPHDNPYWSRVMQFYTRFEPGKATDAHVANVLRKYSGREQELMQQLASKYSDSITDDDVRSNACYGSVVEVYTRHCPGKLHTVPALIRKYWGREDVMLQALREKYGAADDDGGAQDGGRGGSAREHPAPQPGQGEEPRREEGEGGDGSSRVHAPPRQDSSPSARGHADSPCSSRGAPPQDGASAAALQRHDSSPSARGGQLDSPPSAGSRAVQPDSPASAAAAPQAARTAGAPPLELDESPSSRGPPPPRARGVDAADESAGSVAPPQPPEGVDSRTQTEPTAAGGSVSQAAAEGGSAVGTPEPAAALAAEWPPQLHVAGGWQPEPDVAGGSRRSQPRPEPDVRPPEAAAAPPGGSRRTQPRPGADPATAAQPADSADGSAAEQAASAHWRAKLQRFYVEHNPAMLRSVDSLLQRYRGQEPALYDAVVAKYSGGSQRRAQPPQSRAEAAAAARAALSATFGGLRAAWAALSPQGARVAVADVRSCFDHCGAAAAGDVLLSGAVASAPRGLLSRKEFYRLISEDVAQPPFAGGPCGPYSSPPRQTGRSGSPPRSPGWGRSTDGSGRVWLMEGESGARVASLPPPASTARLIDTIQDGAAIAAAHSSGKPRSAQQPHSSSGSPRHRRSPLRTWADAPQCTPLMEEMLRVQREHYEDLLARQQEYHSKEVAALKQEIDELKAAGNPVVAPQYTSTGHSGLDVLESRLRELRQDISDIAGSKANCG